MSNLYGDYCSNPIVTGSDAKNDVPDRYRTAQSLKRRPSARFPTFPLNRNQIA